MWTNIPLLMTRNSPCFLISAMLPSICGHESFLLERCSAFVKILGDGYADDKHLSRVSLSSFITRTLWPNLFFLTSRANHTRCQWYHIICRFIDGLYCAVLCRIVVYCDVSYCGHFPIWYANLCIVASPISIPVRAFCEIIQWWDRQSTFIPIKPDYEVRKCLRVW